MNLYLRLLRVLLAARFRERIDILNGESRVGFRVLPNDLDLNMHMNNGRYFTIMDLGRIDLIVRCGLFSIMMNKKWMPVVGTTKMSFFRSLSPFQHYTVRTSLIGWDAKWFYIEQAFLCDDGKVAALGTIKGLFQSKKGKIPTAVIFGELSLEAPETLIPADAHALRTARE